AEDQQYLVRASHAGRPADASARQHVSRPSTAILMPFNAFQGWAARSFDARLGVAWRAAMTRDNQTATAPEGARGDLVCASRFAGARRLDGVYSTKMLVLVLGAGIVLAGLFGQSMWARGHSLQRIGLAIGLFLTLCAVGVMGVRSTRRLGDLMKRGAARERTGLALATIAAAVFAWAYRHDRSR